MATKAAPSKAPQKSAPANQTLYCTNLNDKIQKPDLRRALYMLFSTYGPVLDVVALKTMKMRGQAHIVFRDVQASTQAMRDLQNTDFFGKKMKIEYAKGKSDTIAKLDGTYRLPTAQAAATTSTELQRSIFDGPPTLNASTAAPASAPSPQGTKRAREEESDDDVSMEEDDDDDAAMDVSDED